MKRVLLITIAAMSLSACDRIPTKIGEEVRQVEVGNSIVSDGWNEVVYRTDSDLNSLDFSNSEPQLYVNLIDVQSGQTFKVDLGYDCAQFPLPNGHKFLARFDRSASKAKPEVIFIDPQSYPIRKYLCG